MEWACSTYWCEEKCIHIFGGKTEGKDHLEDPGVDGRIISKSNFKKWNGRP
jgi:hypothetical protein